MSDLEETLILRAQAGDKAALTALYRGLRAKVHRFLHYRVGHREAAEDLTTDVVPLKGEDAAYRVLTPCGEATVHGTSFGVAVADDGSARYAVNLGAVEVMGAGSNVFLGTQEKTLSDN